MNIDLNKVFYLGVEGEYLQLIYISGEIYKVKIEDFFKALFPTLNYCEHKESIIEELVELQREADRKLRQIYGEYFIIRETSAIDIREDLKVELSQVLRDSLRSIK